ncbi:hypothetical protein VYU27_010344, partial [Nannochloropsis oceanica]
VGSFDELGPLVSLPGLQCIYLEHNPIYKEFEYRMKIAALLPALKQLDATPIPGR